MLNTVFFGRLGADAEQKSSRNGNSFVTFRACTDRFDSEKKERVGDWVSVTFPGEVSTRLFPYLKKGTLVEVTGTITVSAYMTRDGAPAASVDVYASRVSLMNVGGSSGKTADNSDCGTFTKKEEQKVVAAAAPKVEAPKFPPTQPADDDDDLPF